MCSSRMLAGVLGGLLVVACTGSDEPPAARGGGTPFTVWVFDERLTHGGEDRPLSGVTVAFDPPGGGERIMRTTEADGHVTFDGDFEAGGASVTVLSDDHVYVTMLEASPETARARPNAVGKPASDLVVFPPRFDRVARASTIELRGNVFGKVDPDHVVSLAVSSLPRLGEYQAFESTYVLRAPRDRPFFILGHETSTLVDQGGVIVENEHVKSFRLDLEARREGELLDIELARLPALPASRRRVHADVPLGEGAPFGAGTRAVSSIGSVDSGLVVGLYTAHAASEDGRRFDVDLTLVDTDVGSERLASEAVLLAPDGSRTVRREPGIVPDGFTWTDFPLPPTISDPDASRVIDDPIPLDGFPKGADLVAEVFAGGNLVWLLHGPPGGPRERTFRVPYRAEIASASVQVFALSLSARDGRVELSGGGVLYRRMSVARDIRLRKR